MNVYTACLRPLFFRLDPELVHNIARVVLKHPAFRLLFLFAALRIMVRDERLRVRLGGIEVANPVGLAPGFDKDCEMIDALARLGFGYLVPGSVLPQRRSGNPRPRIVRCPEQHAIVSCMGLPSRGLDHATECLMRRKRGSVPVFVNISGFGQDDYLACIERLYPLADGIELSLSCSNCSGAGADLLNLPDAGRLFALVAKETHKPVFIKVPAYNSDKERQNRLDLLQLAIERGIDGVTVTTGWTVEEKRLALGSGTLSGRPLFDRTLKVVKEVYGATRGRCAIKARGGIFSGEDAFAAIAAGATTVEIYSAFIYRGWHAAGEINRKLLALLEAHNIQGVESLRGTDMRIQL